MSVSSRAIRLWIVADVFKIRRVPLMSRSREGLISRRQTNGEESPRSRGLPCLKLLIKTPTDSWLSRLPNLFLPVHFLSLSLYSYPVLPECPRLNQCVQSSELSSRRGWTRPERKIEGVSWLSSDSCTRHKRRPRTRTQFLFTTSAVNAIKKELSDLPPFYIGMLNTRWIWISNSWPLTKNSRISELPIPPFTS